MKYKNSGAHRTVYVNGELNFNYTTAFLPSTIWPIGRTFTFGGREQNMQYTGYPLNGYMTDVQIFSKGLTREEMISYTTCQKVSFYLAFIRIANEYA